MGNQGRNRPNKGPRHGGGQHRDRDGNRDPNYRPGQNGGQRDDQPPEMLEVDESEIISKEDLAATKSSMNLSVLKAKPIYELVKMAESMGVDTARSRMVIFIIAAIVTPTPDPLTQTIFAAPLYALFELAIIFGRRIEKGREARRLG